MISHGVLTHMDCSVCDFEIAFLKFDVLKFDVSISLTPRNDQRCFLRRNYFVLSVVS